MAGNKRINRYQRGGERALRALFQNSHFFFFISYSPHNVSLAESRFPPFSIGNRFPFDINGR